MAGAGKGSRVKKLVRIALWVCGGGIALLLSIAVVTQTQFFRDRLRSAVLGQLDSLLNATVYLGEIRGNLVTGFSVDSVSLALEGVPVVTAGRVDLGYDLFSLPGKTLAVKRISLLRPQIWILRDRQRRWNLSRMVRPSSSDQPASTDTTLAILDWKLSLDALEIQDGSLTVLDSMELNTLRDRDAINFGNITLHDLNLLVSARLSEDRQFLDLTSLSFAVARPEFRLVRASCVVRVTHEEAVVQNLVVVTSGSDVRLNASLKKVDLLGGISLPLLKRSPLQLSLRSDPLDLRELRRFIPAVYFLDGVVAATVEVGGEFGNMDIQRLDLKHEETTLFLRGKLKSLDVPENLALEVKIAESTIDPAALQTLLPGLSLPEFPRVGPVTLNLEYEGRPLDFRTRFDLRSNAGIVRSPGISLRIGGPQQLTYIADVSVDHLDISALTGNPLLVSALNGRVELNGEGVSLRTLASTLDVRIDSSSIRDLPLPRARLYATGKNAQARATLLFVAGDMYGNLAGELTQRSGVPPAYALDGEVRAINLERFLHDPAYRSDLTLRLDAHGSGFEWNELVGEAVLDFSSSHYREYTIDSGMVRIDIDSLRGGGKQLTFESNVLDFVVTGSYDLPYLLDVLSYESYNIRAALADKLAPIDTTLIAPVDRRELAMRAAELRGFPESMNVQFGVLMKNLEPISVVTGVKTFNGIGTLTGSIWGKFDDLAVQADLDLEEFFYGTEEAGTLVENGSVILEASRITPEDLLTNAVIQLGVKARSLHLNRTELDTLEGELDVAGGKAQFWGNVSVDRSVQFWAGGSGEILGDVARIALSGAGMRHGTYGWTAEKGGSIEISRAGLMVRSLNFRQGMESLSLEGSFALNGKWDGHVKAADLDLSALRHLLDEGGPAPPAQSLFSGRASVTIDAGGTLTNPWYLASLQAENVSYRGARLGRVSGNFRYRDSSLHLQLDSRSSGRDTSQEGELNIRGTLPVNLALSGVEGSRVTGDPLDLTVRANAFQMGVFDPFLAAFNDLTGHLSCTVHVGGSFRSPQYSGDLAITHCSFLFQPNNIEYLFDGTFRADGERIRVVEATFRNLPEDVNRAGPGIMHITGDLGLTNFRPGDFRLGMTGDLLVVKETTRRSSLEVSGYLFVEIGPQGLSLTGEIERSLLKGQVFIRNSSLVFPPTEGQVAEESSLSVPVVLVNDTARVVPRRRPRAADRYFVSRNGLSETGEEAREVQSVSFVDGMRYDLEIESVGGTTEIEMIFNSLTSEKLVANIDGRFTILGDKSRWFGELSVSRAYYTFIKRFDAEGKIRYTGDFLNPELDIQATYRGNRLVQDSTGTTDEQVIVTFLIAGSREKPKIDYAMKIDEVDYLSYRGPKSNDVQSDAIQFILYGTFPLTAAQRTEATADVQRTLGVSFVTGATSLLTGALSEYLRAQTGFISSVEFSYGGPGKPLSESAEIRLSGSLWNGYWRYGGKILDDPLGNANFSLMYSFGSVFGDPALRNLMFELERRVESATIQTTELKRINSARIFYRLSF